jgi:hypothetical protein
MAKKDPAAEGLKRLKNIEGELEDIKENTGGKWRWFLRGVLQGAGIIVGTIIAATALGWFLSILGVVPGFGDMAEYLRTVTERVSRF